MTSKRVCHPDPVIKPNLQCPYNPSHYLFEERFQRHLITCAKSYPEIASKMETCPFHQTHVVLKTKMRLHIQECSYRKIVTETKPEQAPLKEIAKPLGAIAVTEEDWENEVNETAYDPMKKIAQLQIAPTPSGMKPAERKEFKNKTRVVMGSATGNIPEGADIPKDTTIPPLPYQPSGGRGRGKSVCAAPSVTKPQSQEILAPIKHMAVTEVPKPKSKKIAASFSGPAQFAGAPQPRTIGRGRLGDDTEDFPPLGPVIGGGRGRPVVDDFPPLGAAASAARGRPPPGFEGYIPAVEERMSALRL